MGLYWQIGHAILERQHAEGWGTKVIERLAVDLRAAFPAISGLSRSNLFYMRGFAAAWRQSGIVQQPVGRLPGGHVTVLLDRLEDQAERDWYAAAAAEHGWSRNVLLNQIMNPAVPAGRSRAVELHGQLPPADSDLASS